MVEINFNYLEDSALLKDDYTTSQRLKQLYEIDDYRDVLINAADCKMKLDTMS